MQLACRDVTVRFGGACVLDRVSLSIESGTFACVLGVNGAGKSTLLRAVAGLLPATGEITLGGASLSGLALKKRARMISYLPQDAQVAWPLAARDVVMLGRVPHLSSLTNPSAADEAAVDAALASVDAAGLSTRVVTELSGGERARVLLARALAVEAPLIIADEPIAALDPRHQIEVMQLFSSLARQGRTVIAAVHDLSLASRFADQAIVVDGRRVAAAGAAEAILTDELVGRVFGITVVAAERNGRRIILPWAPT